MFQQIKTLERPTLELLTICPGCWILSCVHQEGKVNLYKTLLWILDYISYLWNYCIVSTSFLLHMFLIGERIMVDVIIKFLSQFFRVFILQFWGWNLTPLFCFFCKARFKWKELSTIVLSTGTVCTLVANH